jgi:hypothetical protein
VEDEGARSFVQCAKSFRTLGWDGVSVWSVHALRMEKPGTSDTIARESVTHTVVNEGMRGCSINFSFIVEAAELKARSICVGSRCSMNFSFRPNSTP